MSYILTDIGEEWYTETAIDGSTITFCLYNDSTDSIGDGDDIATIDTEPEGAAYSRQDSTVSTAKIGGNWGFQNDSEILFDVSDSTQTVDGAFMVTNFDSEEAGDGGTATDHLIATAELSQSRDLSQVDEVTISVNESGVTVN